MALGRVADTSWLYALFDADDTHHAMASAWIHEPIVTLVPASIMDETLDLVAYRGGPAAAREAHGDLLGFPHFDLWYPVDEQAATAIWLQNPTLSLHDAHAVACARSTGFPLATFDERQKAAVGTLKA